MDDPKKNFLQNFDWKSFEQFFGARLPQIPADRLKDTNWIESYVQDAIKQAFPQNSELNLSSKRYSAEVFETHNSVIVKISIPDQTQAKNARVKVGANVVKLEGLPGKGSQLIKLGSAVIESSCKAVYKDGVLQLHLRKRADDDFFHEAPIRFRD
ncbi:Hsp20/alpha crystallin family protein [Paenibacillus sp. GYB004]|uniref:Hsp20/alpha crystallin family protein n=1 Tax=Paenibacillus sp. GYB004 TaxID=2994393 RepID=UPI002F966D8F